MSWQVITCVSFRYHGKLTHRGGSQHCLSKLYSSAALEVQLELAFSHPVAIGLSPALALYVISAKHRLIQLDFAQCHERETERLHLLFGILRIEYHPVRRKVETTSLRPDELRLLLTMKLHCDIVAEQKNPRKLLEK